MYGQIFENSATTFSGMLQRWRASPEESRCTRSRQRNLLPLPPLAGWPPAIRCPAEATDGLLHVANWCIAGLNLLEADFKSAHVTPCGGLRPTACQASAMLHIAGRTLRFLTHGS